MFLYILSRDFNKYRDILCLVFFIYYFKTKLSFCSIFFRILEFFFQFTPPLQFNLIFFSQLQQKNTNLFLFMAHF